MVFGDLLSGVKSDAVFLGSPEAEAEATSSSRLPLTEVYEDFHDLLRGLSGEKFVVVGRKGSGKSAFAEYVYARSLSEPNLHCDFIKKSDSNLEYAVQCGADLGVDVNIESFFRWVIYTNILRMFVKLPVISESKRYRRLKVFLEKNSGYIKVDELEIKQLVSKYGFNVLIKPFVAFFEAQFGKNVELYSERAPYFKLLNHLEELVVNLLSSEEIVENENSFVLFFDDLDIGFDVNNPDSVSALVSLLRACRYINNDIFGKNNIKAKAIILMRDDIEAFLAGEGADTAKLFASYSSHINWYQELYATDRRRENDLNLKRFICRRIKYAFDKNDMEVGDDPWASLVAENDGPKSSFKFVVEQTMFRPRDLLLFFLPLDTGKYSYPLAFSDIKFLVDAYSKQLAQEIKNELSSFYTRIEIETIFRSLAILAAKQKPTSYDEVVKVVVDNCDNISVDELINHLYERSIIGTVDKRGWYTFKCRQEGLVAFSSKIDKRQSVVVQYGIRNYLTKRGYVN